MSVVDLSNSLVTLNIADEDLPPQGEGSRAPDGADTAVVRTMLRLGRAVRIPCIEDPDVRRLPYLAIQFRNRRRGLPPTYSRGVHLADLFRSAWQRSTLRGARDPVFGGVPELKFRINWPGYESERTTISVVSAHGGPMTRLELARNVMYAYGYFFKKVVEERIRSRGGPYKIALNQNKGAKGPDSVGVKLAELHLVEFREPIPGDDHWFAEMDIVRARRYRV